MQTIKITGQPGDEIALDYNGATLIVKLDDDAIVPDFVEVLIRALKVDAYRVANTCVDFYHRGNSPEDPYRARFAQSRDLLFESIAPNEPEETEEPVEAEPEQQEEQVEESTEQEEEPAPKKKTRKTASKES